MTEGRLSIGVRTLLVAGIFALAVFARVADLGAIPLSDGEAGQALWAAQGTGEGSPFWPLEDSPSASSGAYQAVTWVVFDLVGGSEATARLFPAVLGALIVLVPWLLRRRLGEPVALMVGFVLAVSPMLVAGSRTAGGESASVVGLSLAAALAVLTLDGDLAPRKAAALLGASLAVGLAGSPLFYLGVISLLVGLVLSKVLGPREWSAERVRELAGAVGPSAIGIGIVGAFAISVAAGFLPRGATALAEGLRQAIVGFIPPGEMPAATPILVLLSYEPLLLVFGVIGAVSTWRDREPLMMSASLWAGAGLLLAIVYPGRQGSLMVWCVLPLAFLAGKALVREAEHLASLVDPRPALGVGALLLFLILYAGLQLSAYASGIGPGVAPLDPGFRLGIALGALSVAALIAVLIGFGWSRAVARGGAALAAATMLFLGTLASGSWLNYGRGEEGAHEIWSVSAPTYGLQRLRSTLISLSAGSRGVPNDLPLAIVGDPPPSLVWAVRSFGRFSTSDSGLPESPPLLLIAADTPVPEFASEFLGQTIPIAQRWSGSSLATDLVGWWWRRTLPVQETTWVLLVRSDVATHGESGAGPGSP